MKITRKMVVLTTSSRLTKALINVPDFRYGLFDMLDATDASLLMDICKIPMDQGEMRRYFNPIKDLVNMREIVDFITGLGYTPYLMGLDTYNLITRIKDPVGCWESDNSNTKMTFWLIITTNGVKTVLKQRRLADMVELLAMRAKEMTSPNFSVRKLEFSTGRPYTLYIHTPDNVYHPALTDSTSNIIPDLEDIAIRPDNPVPLPDIPPTCTSNPIELINGNFLIIDKEERIVTGLMNLETDPYVVNKIEANTSQPGMAYLFMAWMGRVEGADNTDLTNIYNRMMRFKISEDPEFIFHMWISNPRTLEAS